MPPLSSPSLVQLLLVGGGALLGLGMAGAFARRQSAFAALAAVVGLQGAILLVLAVVAADVTGPERAFVMAAVVGTVAAFAVVLRLIPWSPIGAEAGPVHRAESARGGEADVELLPAAPSSPDAPPSAGDDDDA